MVKKKKGLNLKIRIIELLEDHVREYLYDIKGRERFL